MTLPLIDLPFAADSLAPAISAETLSYHHTRHHRAYVDKTNKAIKGTDLEEAELTTIIARARRSDEGLFNNAAQAWNHGFFWHSLSPDSGAPSGELAHRIAASFGSIGAFKERLVEVGSGHFGSGWVWLAEKGGTLSIEETHDGDTLADSEWNPLLVIDLWEHAYYLDHQNARPAYLEAVVELIDWNFAAENLSRGLAWSYPMAVIEAA